MRDEEITSLSATAMRRRQRTLQQRSTAAAQYVDGAQFTSPSVAQELAAHLMGVKSVALPGEPSGVDRDVMGQLPSAA